MLATEWAERDVEKEDEEEGLGGDVAVKSDSKERRTGSNRSRDVYRKNHND